MVLGVAGTCYIISCEGTIFNIIQWFGADIFVIQFVVMCLVYQFTSMRSQL